MRQETMAPEERIAAAMRLERPDRVPIVPCTPAEPIAGLAGTSVGALYADPERSLETHLRVFDEFGGWDAFYGGVSRGITTMLTGVYPMKVLIPGKELPDDYALQVVEEPRLQLEDYDKIYEMGWDPFFFGDYLWRLTELGAEEVRSLTDEAAQIAAGLEAELATRGVRPWIGLSPFHPFFTLSLARSFVTFTEDLYYRPDVVQRVIDRMTDELIPKMIDATKRAGLERCFFVEERASGFYYPPAVFERFWMPYTRKIVDALWSEGITTVFHLDGCWDRNIASFRELPRASYVLSLDSTTDIFAAKEALRGHGALSGDVSAALLSIGRPEEVKAYVERLIDEVGGDGGFILGVGCSAPPDVEPENWRAFLETGKTYELSRR